MRTATPIVLALLIALLAITTVGGIAVMRTHTAVFGQTNPLNQLLSNFHPPPSSHHPVQSNLTPSQAQHNQTCNYDGCSGDD